MYVYMNIYRTYLVRRLLIFPRTKIDTTGPYCIMITYSVQKHSAEFPWAHLASTNQPLCRLHLKLGSESALLLYCFCFVCNVVGSLLNEKACSPAQAMDNELRRWQINHTFSALTCLAPLYSSYLDNRQHKHGNVGQYVIVVCVLLKAWK